MPCNLNFNQWNTGCLYPRPIFTWCRNLIALLNQSTTEIVNPIVETSSAIATSSSPQTVLSGGLLNPVETLNTGSSILYNNAGTFTLLNGRYIISFNINSINALNGTSSYGIYLDDVLLPSSLTTVSGTAGSASTLSNSVLVQITNPTGAITIRNTNSTTQTVNNANIVLQKI